MGTGIDIILFFAMLWVMRRLDELKAKQIEIQVQLTTLNEQLGRKESAL